MTNRVRQYTVDSYVEWNYWISGLNNSWNDPFGAALATKMARLSPIYNWPIEISIKKYVLLQQDHQIAKECFHKSLKSVRPRVEPNGLNQPGFQNPSC